MRIVRFAAHGLARYGMVKGDCIAAIAGSPFRRLGATRGWPGPAVREYPLPEVKLLAPVRPSKIVAVGLNYRSHAAETGMPLPATPLIFLKPSTAVVGPGGAIVLPHGSARVDYEGELAVVIGRRARNVRRERAADYVLGYTCLNDVSERHVQEADGQWTRAKGFDTFAPMGPWVETELDPSDLELTTRLNGEVRQHARTSDLIFGVADLVEFISGVMTLLPGDIISSGTPAGIGRLSAGDVVEVSIEGIGALRNPVVAAAT